MANLGGEPNNSKAEMGGNVPSSSKPSMMGVGGGSSKLSSKPLFGMSSGKKPFGKPAFSMGSKKPFGVLSRKAADPTNDFIANEMSALQGQPPQASFDNRADEEEMDSR